LAKFRKWATVRVEAVNHALRGLPEDRVRYHMCWGSWNGPHTNDLPLKDIVDLLLTIRAGGYLLEMANPRHEHEWHVCGKCNASRAQGATARGDQPCHQRR
jgi:5-methyltetrahydropteroyltriglutamate--homocysteine methyltransferase